MILPAALLPAILLSVAMISPQDSVQTAPSAASIHREPVPDEGIASRLWEQFGPQSTEPKKHETFGQTGHSLITPGLVPKATTFRPGRANMHLSSVNASAEDSRRDTASNQAREYDDWQDAATNLKSGGNQGTSSGGPGLTVLVVGFAALVVLTGTILMPR